MALADIVSLTRGYLQDSPWQDMLNGAYTAGTASITVDSSGSWEEGDIAEFQDDGALAYVAADAAASSVTIEAAYGGTTDANHADNTRIFKNPRYYFQNISRAIDVVLDEIFPDVYEIKTTTLTPDVDNTLVYAVPSDYIGFIDLAQVAPDPPTAPIHIIPGREHWNLPTGTWASGIGLEIPSWGRTDANATLTYAAKPTTTTTDTQLQRIAALGAAVKLLGTEAAQKADREDEFERGRNIIFARRELKEDFISSLSAYRAEVSPRVNLRKYRVRRQMMVG